jgi:hypothetical protein
MDREWGFLAENGLPTKKSLKNGENLTENSQNAVKIMNFSRFYS